MISADGNFMLAKCMSGRKLSPLMIILIITLIVYSISLLKRLMNQQKSAVEIHNSRRKRDILPDFSSFFGENDEMLDENIGLYIITPTYPRPEQLPELTRLSQTLMVSEFKGSHH